ncbi:hypothetical protein ASPBRDRAFT_54629 [Aspergillus brasiliensis CBS 101740]|uniref:Uncharacterized protein n=1 Tax=Aspergillus brasiliensis (strain CBS 101740 / IMI 381727 / IBT 21946) TaxID=767769 RepID=A0A1L9UMV5_ASPBC|nr:hypothetical protein ASPBRDRAFT_54629 [Aspergillus brasiliensis CBS 101740]
MPKLDLIPHRDIVTDNCYHHAPLQLGWNQACYSSPIAVHELLIGTSLIPRCILFARPITLLRCLFPALQFPTIYFVPVVEKPDSESVLRQSYGFLHVLCRPSVAALHHH